MPVITLITLEGKTHRWEVDLGTNLRLALLEKGCSPYTRLTRTLNCGGRGLCATCGVWIEEGAPSPVHWHDRAADRFGYPRLSCQILIRQDITISMVNKWIWGGRRQ
jgi:ferredoxin